MIRRITHDATPEELQRSVDDIDAELAILDRRIGRTSYRNAISIDNVSFSLLHEWQSQRRQLQERKDDLLLQIKQRKEDSK